MQPKTFVCFRVLRKSQTQILTLFPSRRFTLYLLSIYLVWGHIDITPSALSLQDLPVLQEAGHESGMLPPGSTADQTVPYPTHNLVFANGILKTWDGQ